MREHSKGIRGCAERPTKPKGMGRGGTRRRYDAAHRATEGTRLLTFDHGCCHLLESEYSVGEDVAATWNVTSHPGGDIFVPVKGVNTNNS
jgi:hypothetical protein